MSIILWLPFLPTGLYSYLAKSESKSELDSGPPDQPLEAKELNLEDNGSIGIDEG